LNAGWQITYWVFSSSCAASEVQKLNHTTQVELAKCLSTVLSVICECFFEQDASKDRAGDLGVRFGDTRMMNRRIYG